MLDTNLKKDIELYSEVEKYNYSLYYKHRNILDAVFKEILANSEIKNILKQKKLLSDVLMIVDEKELIPLLSERKNNICKSEKCNCFFYNFDLKGTSEEIAKKLLLTFSQENEADKKFCFCTNIKRILGCALFQDNSSLAGLFCKEISDVFFVKKRYSFGFSEISIYIHEYLHYLTAGKEIRDSQFSFFNEGMTQLLTNYFLNGYFKKMKEKDNLFVTKKTGHKILVTKEDAIKFDSFGLEKYNKYTKKNRPLYVYPSDNIMRVVKYSFFEKHYFSLLKDLHTLNNLSEKQINHLSSDYGLTVKAYLYNMLLLYYIMKDIGVFKVLKSYFLSDFGTFIYLLKDKYGAVKLNKILNIFNNHIVNDKYGYNEISFEEFKQIISILQINLKVEKLKEMDSDF